MFDYRKNYRPAGHFILSLLLCLALICTPVFAGGSSGNGAFGSQEAFAADSACTDLEGTNSSANDYKRHARPVYSYLTVSGSGYMRVQGYDSGLDFTYTSGSPVTDGSFDVVYYDSSFNVTSHMYIAAELPLFGAFYESDSNFFIVSGQMNPDEDDSTEVYRITKYDKNWNRLGSCGLYGANTTVPFDAGSCRIDGYGNRIVIRTCHEMYADYNGCHHQASLMMIVNTDDMEITGAQYSVSDTGNAYVSHSFNQFIKIKDGETAILDHGDGHPRGIALLRFANDPSYGIFWSSRKSISYAMSYPGDIGENDTGASAGGLEITANGYLAAGNAIYQHNSELDDSLPRDVFVTAIDTSSGSAVTGDPVWLTDVGNSNTASTPHLVRISDNKFMVLWTLSDQVQYTLVDGSGNKLTDTYSIRGDLSDCQPIVRNGNVIWYTWGDEEDSFFVIPVDSPGEAQVITKHSGHDWETVSASGGVAKVQCSKCGASNTFSYPASFYLGYSTDRHSYSYGDKSAEVSLSDTVHFRSSYRVSDDEYTTFDKLILEADSENVLINNKNNTVTFADEGTYTITARCKYDRNTYASIIMEVSDPAHVWEFVSAENGTITYKCNHCGKTKTKTYPTELRLGYSLDGYSFTYGNDHIQVDNDSTVVFNGVYKDSDGWLTTFDDLVFKTSDPDHAVIEDGGTVHFTAEGIYTITASYKYDPSVTSSITVRVLSSDHVWEVQSAENGVATLVCKDCGMTITEEYPTRFMMGYGSPSSGYIFGHGSAYVARYDIIYIMVYGFNDMNDFVIETDRPEDSVIDSENGTIKFLEAGEHKITVHHKYDPKASDFMFFEVNKDLESVKLSASPAKNCAVGTEVTFDAAEDGGFGHEVYTYTLTDPSGKETELYVGRMDDHDSRSCTWIPEKQGTYTISVSVYDVTKPDIVVEDEITYVVSAKAHTTMPAEEYSIPYSKDSFGNELLSDAPGWEFDADELTYNGSGLKVGEPVTITAHYTADDRDDYDVNEVTVSVTRSACDHASTIVEGSKEATCCEEGATGDEICTECGEIVRSSVAIPVDSTNHTGIRTNAAKPAAMGEDGMTASSDCTACGAVIKAGSVIPGIDSVSVTGPANKKYNGSAKKAVIEIRDRTGSLLKDGRDYHVSYENNVAPGIAYVDIEFTGKYEGKYRDSFEIVKGDNPMAAGGKAVKVKASKVKKKNQNIIASKAMTISHRQGKVSYSLLSVKKAKFRKHFKVNASTGAITVKKKLKKGTYKLQIRVTDTGNANYNPVSKTVTVTVKVK